MSNLVVSACHGINLTVFRDCILYIWVYLLLFFLHVGYAILQHSYLFAYIPVTDDTGGVLHFCT